MAEPLDTPYQKEWQAIRFKNRLFLGLLGLLIPLHFGLFLPPEIIRNLYGAVLMIVWAFFGVTFFAVHLITCPRCQGLYYRWYRKWNALAPPDCKECGLRYYEGSTFKTFGSRFGL